MCKSWVWVPVRVQELALGQVLAPVLVRELVPGRVLALAPVRALVEHRRPPVWPEAVAPLPRPVIDCSSS